jgi:hypothetical protein
MSHPEPSRGVPTHDEGAPEGEVAADGEVQLMAGSAAISRDSSLAGHVHFDSTVHLRDSLGRKQDPNEPFILATLWHGISVFPPYPDSQGRLTFILSTIAIMDRSARSTYSPYSWHSLASRAETLHRMLGFMDFTLDLSFSISAPS